MRYAALATDYDGTLAHHGTVDDATMAALQRWKAHGRRLILVTGRQLDDLVRVFPGIDVFDRVVAENGAELYDPKTHTRTSLALPPDPSLVEALEQRGVEPLSVGRSIVATWTPHEQTVLTVIHELGLEHQLIFNKGAVMVLPPGVNKASGLRAALVELELSHHNVIAVGDAENDHAFVEACGWTVAVANGLASLREHVDWVTHAERGAGVAELIEHVLLHEREIALPWRRHVLLGCTPDGREVGITSGDYLLVAGASGSGKTSSTAGLLERISEQAYQVLVVDPEGDYGEFARAVEFGGPRRPPELGEVMHALTHPSRNVVVNLLGLRLDERPRYFEQLLQRVHALRRRQGRPHFIVIDEAHHCLLRNGPRPSVPTNLDGLVLVTVRPDHLPSDVLARVSVAVAAGVGGNETLAQFLSASGRGPVPTQTLARPDALLWTRTEPHAVEILRMPSARTISRRHRRKYATGELGQDKSFYFRGPSCSLNLRAFNLQMFVQLALGVDDDTWLHHLRRHDYSRWLLEAVKDEPLARAVEAIERADLPASASRERIVLAIDERYTLPE